jgi:hypothetical protein
VIVVSQDVEGVRMAALELLENSLDSEKNQRRLDAISPDDFDQMRKLVPASKLSPGYHDWAIYLFWLERHVGSIADLRADEADGLSAIQRARQQFEQDHPPCPGCGTRLGNRMLRRCCSCGRELR